MCVTVATRQISKKLNGRQANIQWDQSALGQAFECLILLQEAQACALLHIIEAQQDDSAVLREALKTVMLLDWTIHRASQELSGTPL